MTSFNPTKTDTPWKGESTKIVWMVVLIYFIYGGIHKGCSSRVKVMLGQFQSNHSLPPSYDRETEQSTQEDPRGQFFKA